MRKTEIIPVIHMLNHNQVMTNVKLCVSCGIQKVFLINHVVSVEDLIQCALEVKKVYPSLWVGINMLGVITTDAITREIEVDGLWCDASVISSLAKEFRKFKGMFFGGLVFKYQPQPKDLKEACEDSTFATDVSTTSGPGTGKAAGIDKIKMIRELLGDHPIASGVSEVEDYNGIVDYLLVASSITSRTEMIYEDKLKSLIDKLV